MNYFGEGAAVEAKRFIEKPDFRMEVIGRFDGQVWALILSARPDYAKYCPFERFNASDWVTLLTNRPEMAKNIKCDGVYWWYKGECPKGRRHITQTDVLEPYGRLEYVMDENSWKPAAVITGICEIPFDVKSLKIPSKVDGFPVTKIQSLKILSKRWRYHRFDRAWDGIGPFRLEIAEGIEEIADYAFIGLTITTLIIPKSAVRIGVHAFDGSGSPTWGNGSLFLADEIFQGGRKLERKQA